MNEQPNHRMYSRTNRITGEVRTGFWDDLCDLDVREWTRMTDDLFDFGTEANHTCMILGLIYHHTVHCSARFSIVILKSAQERTSPPLWTFYAIKELDVLHSAWREAQYMAIYMRSFNITAVYPEWSA